MSGISCPQCAGPTHVFDSRATPDVVRRRRECEDCGCCFTTEERFAAMSLQGRCRRDKLTIEAARAAANIPTGGTP